MKIKLIFIYKISFETEAQGNSQMGYFDPTILAK